MSISLRSSLEHLLRRCPVTCMLFAANVLVFLILSTVPNSADFFLVNAELGFFAKPWTLWTVFFSHEMFIHIALNMLLLVTSGSYLEPRLGGGHVASMYCLAGIMGSLTLRPLAELIGFEGGLIAGASAATFGLVAAFAAIAPDRNVAGGRVKHYAISLFAGNLILLVLNPAISVGAGAHFIGMVVGLLYGYAVKSRIGTMERPVRT